MMDIVCRASAIPSVERILLFVQLRKRRLDKSGGRSVSEMWTGCPYVLFSPKETLSYPEKVSAAEISFVL